MLMKAYSLILMILAAFYLFEKIKASPKGEKEICQDAEEMPDEFGAKRLLDVGKGICFLALGSCVFFEVIPGRHLYSYVILIIAVSRAVDFYLKKNSQKKSLG